MTSTSPTVEALILDLLEWVDRRERTYEETIGAWRTSCPRLPVWEDANENCLLRIERVRGASCVRLTGLGRTVLAGITNSPSAFPCDR